MQVCVGNRFAGQAQPGRTKILFFKFNFFFKKIPNQDKSRISEIAKSVTWSQPGGKKQASSTLAAVCVWTVYRRRWGVTGWVFLTASHRRQRVRIPGLEKKKKKPLFEDLSSILPRIHPISMLTAKH